MWLYNGTSLFYSQALMVTVFCRMRFDNYPLDDQVFILLDHVDKFFVKYNNTFILHLLYDIALNCRCASLELVATRIILIEWSSKP